MINITTVFAGKIFQDYTRFVIASSGDTTLFDNLIFITGTTIITTATTNMRDILAYAALILSMSERDYHIFRISNARIYQPGYRKRS